MIDFAPRQDLPTLLLIDDDLVSREVMATVLTSNGYRVQTVADGAASVDLLASRACVPGVILLDAQMPGLSGNRLIEALRAHSPASIFLISSSNVPASAAAAADGFLLKPFTVEALRKLLEAHQPPAIQSDAHGSQLAEPVVSLETLAQLREMMPETAVRHIYAAAISDLVRRIDALEIAVAGGNGDEVCRIGPAIGHAIKGGCGMVGALQAARLGAWLESGTLDGKGNYFDNIPKVIADLRAAAQNLENMIKDELPS
jgi:CheY-like chemotaxis protein